jgi:hypothetical protein
MIKYLLSIILPLITGISGVIGTISDVRYPETNRITRNGIIILVILIISAIASSTLEYLKVNEDEIRGEKAEKSTVKLLGKLDTISNGIKLSSDSLVSHSERILGQVTRVLRPFDDVRISYVVEIPLPNHYLDNWLGRVRKTLKLGLEDSSETAVDRLISNTVVLTNQFNLLPDPQTERAAWRALSIVLFEISIRRPNSQKADLVIPVVSQLPVYCNSPVGWETISNEYIEPLQSQQRHNIEWIGDHLSIIADELPSPQSNWISSDVIKSITDLVGVEVLVERPPFVGSNDSKETIETIKAIRNSMKFRSVTIHIGSHDLLIDGRTCKNGSVIGCRKTLPIKVGEIFPGK